MLAFFMLMFYDFVGEFELFVLLPLLLETMPIFKSAD